MAETRMHRAETQRLAALQSYAVLDTPPEKSFDRLTHLAAGLFDAPIALICLLDKDRQWFKSRHGIDQTQAPRDWAFCDHAIAVGPDATFVVEDASLDPRFAANPTVVGKPGIRFYAGATLTTADGHNLGTLCVLDTKPRASPSADDLQRLKTLARIVIDELELGRTAHSAAESQRLLSLAEEMSGVGRWRLEAAGHLTWSDQVYRIHGVGRGSFDPNLDDAVGFYHPEDQDKVATLVGRALSHQEPFDFQLRLTRADGAPRHVVCRADCELDSRGETLAIVGVFQDVTDTVVALATAEQAMREAQEESRRAAVAEEIAGLGRWRVDFPGGALTWSDQMYAIYGLDRSSAIDSDSVMAMTHPDDLVLTQDRLDRDVAGEASGGRPTIRIVRPDGAIRWVIGYTTVERDEDGRALALVGTLMDVSQKTEAAHRIAESESRHRLLTENLQDLVIKMSPSAVLEYVSPSITSLLGYDPEEVVGRFAEDIVCADDRASCRTTFAAAAAGEEVVRADYRLLHKDGSVVWVDARPRAMRDAETGRIVGVTDVIRDVTERRAAEAALVESEARYRQLADSCTDIVLTIDRDDVIQYVSPSTRRYGYEPEDLLGVSGFTLIHPEDLSKLRAIITELFTTGRVDPSRDRTYRIRIADGSYVWMEGNPAIIYDEAGAPKSVISQLRDVSERQAANAALADSEMRHRLIAESATDIISRMGVDGRVRYFSPSVTDITGYAVDEVTGASMIRLLHPDDVEPTLSAYRDLIGGKSLGAPLSYRVRHKDGHWVWLEGSPILIHDAQGAPSEIIDVRRDISAKVRLEEELRAAKDAAEASVAVKADFMANMSHEIRTPLTAILGFTGLLSARADLNDTVRGQIGRIAGAGKALLAIVNDILDFSKLEAGLVEIFPEPNAPQEILRDALLMFTPQAGAKDLALEVQIGEDVPNCLLLDADKVRQILLNLISNAVKFTDRGAVKLIASYDGPAQRLSIKVQDTGAGMDRAQQERLFQRFSQVDASSTRRHGGTGLGLAICRGLAEAMGGDITVSSQPGRGSVFHVNIHAAAGEFQVMETLPVAASALIDLRVLVADDNPVNLELVRAILTPFEVELTEVASGLKAIEVANLTPFDVILMDIHMPGADGLQAARSIRAGDGPNRHAPILAFSADFELSRNGEGRSDFDGLVRKPLVPSDLIAGLAASQDWSGQDERLRRPA